MSVVYASPASFVGGTWSALTDRFLLGAGDTYEIGTTGGSAVHQLTAQEMPSHNHTIPGAGNVYFASGGDSMWINRPASNTGYVTETSYNGGNSAHNNMPPYLVVYMWKRVA